MDERRATQRGRTLLGGKIVFNGGRSAFDCRVRNLTDDGACLEVESQTGIPTQFQLVVSGSKEPHHCKLAWQSEHRIGVAFEHTHAPAHAPVHAPLQPDQEPIEAPPERIPELVRGHMLALRAALDEVRFGVVLLDHEMRAQFINRAFRKMWRLPDHKADSRPPFVALMYHGRDTRAYDVPAGEIDDYVAERVELVKRGDPTPRDVRLASGEVLRLQCAILPGGGRMLSYTYVTDIVHHADELTIWRFALDKCADGVILLDPDLSVRFINEAARRLFMVPEQQADSHLPYSLLIGRARTNGMLGMPAGMIEAVIASSIARVRAADPSPQDLRTHDGRHILAQCTAMPHGGRMLTLRDVSGVHHDSGPMAKTGT
jgi:PAS domain-containing protein